jgi:hypothetical protein
MHDAQAASESHGSALALLRAWTSTKRRRQKMKRGTLIAAVVLAIGAFACERKHDDKASETTTTSGTVHEEQSTGTGYNYQGSPGVTGGGTTSAGNETTDVSGTNATGSTATGASTGTDRNAQPSTGSTTSMGAGSSDVSGSSLSADQSGSVGAKDAGIAADFDKKDAGHVAPSAGSKAKSGDNKSTPLGDGTSGQYTGGKGTYGGKATHGTGESK